MEICGNLVPRDLRQIQISLAADKHTYSINRKLIVALIESTIFLIGSPRRVLDSYFPISFSNICAPMQCVIEHDCLA